MIKNTLIILKNTIFTILILLIIAGLGYLFLMIGSLEEDVEAGFRSLESKLHSLQPKQDANSKNTNNKSSDGERINFTFSPNKNLIAFVQNVFEKYGSDWKRYWALKIFNPKTGDEKTLVVDDERMSSFEWLNDTNLRVFHSAGTGVRVYLDISVNEASPLFTKDYEGPKIWTPDMKYVQEGLDVTKARQVYFEKTKQLDE